MNLSKRFIQILKNYLWHLPKSYLFALRYGFPSKKLTLIGITGTDGKTTTSTLIYEILKSRGIKCGLMTTIGAKLGDEELDTGLHMTSPDPSLVQKIFNKMVKNGIDTAVIEVTAHALDQFRFGGCRFKVVAVTNITHEHLDYFGNMNAYVQAKRKLLKMAEAAVLNKDDKYFQDLKSGFTKPIISYGRRAGADIKAENIQINQNGLSFRIKGKEMVTDSNYEYQVENIMAALGVCRFLNIEDEAVAKVIFQFPKNNGRREQLDNDSNIKTIIDFAHTPAALEATLKTLRKTNRGKIIVIFGATGGRDKSKRPLMGRVVSEMADIALITADDTRNEKIENINNDIISGIKERQGFQYFSIANRQDAFNMAVKMAKPGDVIIACGKGHEKTILHGKTEYPWSEAEAFRTAFRVKNA